MGERKYVDAHDVEIEIALADRRAAFDELSRAANWVGGTLLALNGGAIIAVLGRNDFTLNEATPAIAAFASGLFAILLAGLSGASFSLWLIDNANRRLDRIGGRQGSPRSGLGPGLICGLSVFASFVCFMLGAMSALQTLEAHAKVRTSASHSLETKQGNATESLTPPVAPTSAEQRSRAIAPARRLNVSLV